MNGNPDLSSNEISGRIRPCPSPLAWGPRRAGQAWDGGTALRSGSAVRPRASVAFNLTVARGLRVFVDRGAGGGYAGGWWWSKSCTHWGRRPRQLSDEGTHVSSSSPLDVSVDALC